ncbi:hypothetical protein [Ferrimonas balearica]|nr:hypothetical protein [Ferrimonas balearica]MBY5993565.1 hypothetical protein [Ferrimonas balearica]
MNLWLLLWVVLGLGVWLTLGALLGQMTPWGRTLVRCIADGPRSGSLVKE